MKLTIALIALLSLSAHSKECGIDKVDALIERLKTKNFGTPEGNGKLPKLTDHDYPLACTIRHDGDVFTWYTDTKDDNYIIKFEPADAERTIKYFGVFHKNN